MIANTGLAFTDGTYSYSNIKLKPYGNKKKYLSIKVATDRFIKNYECSTECSSVNNSINVYIFHHLSPFLLAVKMNMTIIYLSLNDLKEKQDPETLHLIFKVGFLLYILESD